MAENVEGSAESQRQDVKVSPNRPLKGSPWRLVLLTVLGVAILTLGTAFVYSRATHQRLWDVLRFEHIKAALKGEKGYDRHLKLLNRGNLDIKEVALTIDDGPHPEWATMLLDTLKKHKIHATFFVVGKKVNEHPELVRRMLAEGHEVGNHSMTHPRLDTLTLDKVRLEIQGCQDAVSTATGGFRTILMRPPGVRYTEPVLLLARDMGYTTIAENAGAHDYILPGDRSWTPGNPLFQTRVKGIIHDIVKQLKNGVIIDLHDMPATAYAMSDLIDQIQAHGYKIVTAGELLKGVSH